MRRAAALALAVIVVLGVSNRRLAGQDGFRFRTGVDLVSVTATVTDRSGHFAPGLTQDDFTVYEDDRPVEVTHFSAERVPVSLGIVLDTSGSMEGEKIEHALGAIERFLDQLLGPDDEMFIYRFSNRPDLIQDWTSNRQAISTSLRRLRAAGGTAMYDAVLEAVPMAQGGRNRKKALVVISDGNDTNSRGDIRDVRQAVQQTEVLVYAVGIDGRAETFFGTPPRTFPPTTPPRMPLPPIPFPFPGGGGRPRGRPPMEQRYPMGQPGAEAHLNVSALRDLTDPTGGRTEIVRSGRDLDGATSSIADELSKQYYLGYASPGQRDGRWHAIRVEVRDPTLKVRARRGYLATS